MSIYIYMFAYMYIQFKLCLTYCTVCCNIAFGMWVIVPKNI